MGHIRKTVYAAIMYLLSLPVALYVLELYPPNIKQQDYIFLALFFLMIILIERFTLQVKGVVISLSSAITIAVFLAYGVSAELLLLQSTGVIISFMDNPRRKLYRVLITLGMFLWMSLGAAGVYAIIQGDKPFQYNEFSSLWAILCYAIVYFAINHLLLHIFLYFIDGRHHLKQWNNIKWDFYSSLIALPLGVLLYIVQDLMGIKGMIFVSIPIFALCYLLKVYNDLYETNQQLKILSRISAAFTSELDINNTLQSFQNALDEMVDYDQCFIHVKQEETGKLETLLAFNNEVRLNEKKLGEDECYKEEILMAEGVLLGEPIETSSLISVSMVWHDQSIGVLTITSKQKNCFNKRDMNVVRILASQAAVAIQNAKRFELTERRSKKDELTGLYNYRTFDYMLHQMMKQCEVAQGKMSLIIMDIDYFKQVNDRHGHLAGNEILQHIARILEQNVRKQDVVARYGGEEFTVILPDTDVETAQSIAERIRNEIQRSPFRLCHSIDGKGEVIQQVTVSVGVTTYPEHADCAMSLVRHADRAMYIGSKQGGRNRVSVYETG